MHPLDKTMDKTSSRFDILAHSGDSLAEALVQWAKTASWQFLIVLQWEVYTLLGV